MFESFDGTDKIPYQAQIDVLKWLEANWDKSDVFAIIGPTACGKSFLSKTIQRETKADIVTISNQLVRQFKESYPDTIVAIGRQHYYTQDAYEYAHSQAFIPNSEMIFNSVSYFNTRSRDDISRKKVIVLDEADQQLNLFLLRIETSIKLGVSDKNWEPTIAFAKKVLSNRILRHRRELNKKYSVTKETKMLKAMQVKAILEQDSSAVACRIEGDKLIVKPLYIPKNSIKKIFGGSKIILLSGTLFHEDVSDLIGGMRYLTYQMPSPIPVENRPIVYEPINTELNYPINYDSLANDVIELLEKYPQRPAIIHMAYKDMAELSLRIPRVLFHNPDNKEAVLEELHQTKGVLLAAGMTTGIDLKADRCRLNIILKASFPPKTDLWVMKRLSKSCGDTWRIQQVLKYTIQAAGRSTRSVDDSSTTVIADPRIMDLVSTNWDYLPNYFREALVLGVKE